MNRLRRMGCMDKRAQGSQRTCIWACRPASSGLASSLSVCSRSLTSCCRLAACFSSALHTVRDDEHQS